MEIRIGSRARVLHVMAYMFLLLLCMAFVQLYEQASRAGPRQLLPDLQRGRILSADGEVLAMTTVDRPGSFQQKATRHYPFKEQAAQIVGVMGTDSGLEGIEAAFDDQLKAGLDVHLTIDSDLQADVQAAIDQAVLDRQAEYGAVIVMETRTGRLLAMAGSPSFDPNEWRSSTTEQRRNRAALDAYEPGSVIKAFTVGAAMDDGLVARRTAFDIPMRRYVPGSENGRWGSTIGDSVAHGRRMDTEDVLHFSSNVGISMITDRMSNDQLRAHMERFGIGEVPQVLGLNTATGWLQPKRNWSPLVRATTGFGQGMTATLLQTAIAYNALANGGLRIPAHLVDPLPGSAYEGLPASPPDGGEAQGGTTGQSASAAAGQKKSALASEPQELIETGPSPLPPLEPQAPVRVMKAETAAELSTMLRMVIELGLPKAIMVEGYALSGKTGTAQVVVDGRYSSEIYKSTFAGYYPTDRPEVTVAVLGHGARAGHQGSEFAAPVFREVISSYVSLRGRMPAKGLLEEQQDLLKRRGQGEFRR